MVEAFEDMIGQQLSKSEGRRVDLSGFQAALDAWRLGQPGIPSRDDSLWRLALYPQDIDLLLRLEDLEEAIAEMEELIEASGVRN
jgi:hypothetical protein